MTTPRCLSVLGKEWRARQLVLALLVEKFDGVGAEHHVAPAQFWHTPLPMSRSQGMPIEIHDQGSRKLLRPCAGELKTA